MIVSVKQTEVVSMSVWQALDKHFDELVLENEEEVKRIMLDREKLKHERDALIQMRPEAIDAYHRQYNKEVTKLEYKLAGFVLTEIEA